MVQFVKQKFIANYTFLMQKLVRFNGILRYANYIVNNYTFNNIG